MAHLDDLAASLLEHAQVPDTLRVRFYVQFVSDNVTLQSNCYDPAQLRAEFQAAGLSVTAFAERANSYRTGMGREPGRGYLLLTRDQLDQIGTNPITLVIEEVDNNGDSLARMAFQGLDIDRSEALHPGYNPNLPGASKSPAESMYLVHVVDSRREKQNYSIDKSYNLLYDDNVAVGYTKPDLSLFTVREILDDIASIVGWTLSYVDASDPLLDFRPEGFRFIGISAFDALTSVLRAYRLRLSVASNGTPWVVPADLGNTSVFDDAIAGVNRVRLVDHKGFDHPVRIPAEVRVYFPNRDFQFHLYATSTTTPNPVAWSPQEVMSLYPFYRYDETVSGANSSEVHHLWGALPRTTNDVGVTNESALDSHGADLAQQHLDWLSQWDTWREFTYAGILQYEPTGPFSGVAWYDFGEGTFTKLFTIPPDYNPAVSLYEFSEEDWVETIQSPIELAENDDPFPSAPDVTRKHPVGTRLMQGVCTENPGPVNVNEEGDFALYFGIVQGGQVSWNNFTIPIKAFPFFDNMNNGARALLHYNWQLGSGGRWVAIGFQAGSTQQGLSAYALARTSQTEFECNESPIAIENIRYLSPDPNSLPWPGPPTQANNLFGLSGTSQSELLLMYDRTNPTEPIIVQVSHTCEIVHTTGILHDPDTCFLFFPTLKVNAPFQNPLGNISEPLPFVYKELVKRVYWDNDKCTLYYQTDPVCVLNANRIGTPEPVEGVKVYDLREIRQQCLPCDACPCDCTSFDTSIKLTITPEDEHPTSCTTPHPDPACRGNFDGVLCNEYTLDEVQPDTPPVSSACHEPGPTFNTRVWKGTINCPNGTGDPPDYDVYVSCDPAQDPPIMTLCLIRTDTQVSMDEQPGIICQDECGCFLAESDYDWGNHNDLCGDPLSTTCFMWWWVNLLPSKGGYFCCEDQLPSP